MLDIVPVDALWVVANFKETQIEHIRVGQRARITVDGYPDETFEGRVDSFAPGSGSAFSMLPTDNATGNFVRVVQRVPVKIRFAKNPSPDRLVPGLSTRVASRVGTMTTAVPLRLSAPNMRARPFCSRAFCSPR